MVQAKFRGIRARRQLALAQSSVDACVRMGDLMKNDAAHNVHALLKPEDKRRHLKDLTTRKTKLQREIDELETSSYYEKSTKQREIHRRLKAMRLKMISLDDEIKLLAELAEGKERYELAHISSKAWGIEEQVNGQLSIGKGRQDEASAFWLAMESHLGTSANEPAHAYAPAPSGPPHVSVRVAPRFIINIPGEAELLEASKIGANAPLDKVSTSRPGSQQGGPRPPVNPTVANLQVTLSVSNKRPPPIKSVLPAVPVMSPEGANSPATARSASSSVPQKQRVYIQAVHSSSEAMRLQLAHCMLLSTGRIDLHSITIKAVRECQKEVKLMQLLKNVAVSAQAEMKIERKAKGRRSSITLPPSASTDGHVKGREAALGHYVNMLEYVVDMMTLKKRLLLRGLFKRAVTYTLPGYGYNQYQRKKITLIQKYYRGYNTRKLFDILEILQRQQAEVHARAERGRQAAGEMRKYMVRGTTMAHLQTMTTQTACAVLIQRQLRYMWLLRKEKAEEARQSAAVGHIRGMVKARKKEERDAEQISRLDEREAKYLSALKAHKRAMKMERKAMTQRQQMLESGMGDTGGSGMVMLAPGGPRTTMRNTAALSSVKQDFFRADPPPDLALPGEQAGSLHERLVNEAITKLGRLSRKSVLELRGYQKPPRAVSRVLECVCLLLGARPDWDSAKLQLADASFLIDRLLHYGSAGPPNPRALELASRYIAEDDFSPHLVARVSPAAKWMCAWCIAVVHACREAAHRSTLWMPAAINPRKTRSPDNMGTLSSPKFPPLSPPTPEPIKIPDWGGEGGGERARRAAHRAHLCLTSTISCPSRHLRLGRRSQAAARRAQGS